VTTNNTRWRKSSYSGGNANDCVELDRHPGHTGIRDSKSPTGEHLTFEAQAFTAFLTTVKNG
jgi:hypothetical protein